jgi:hypothetical protein
LRDGIESFTEPIWSTLIYLRCNETPFEKRCRDNEKHGRAHQRPLALAQAFPLVFIALFSLSMVLKRGVAISITLSSGPPGFLQSKPKTGAAL